MLVKTKKVKPRRVLLYGKKGIGKSSWANAWPEAYFLNIEDGLDDIECASSPWLRTYDAVIGEIGSLIAGTSPGTPAQTIVIDSADWMESLVFKKVAADEGVESIDLVGYNNGYLAAADVFSYIIEGLNQLRSQGRHIVFLAHEHAIKVQEPGKDTYQKYAPALHKETGAVLTEWVDDVLFANYKTFTKAEDIGFNKTRNIAIGMPTRIITTRETAAIDAKNRLGKIPDEISMEFTDYSKWLSRLDFSTPSSAATPAPQQPMPVAPDGNIAGAIVNGHNVKPEPKELVQA